MGDDEEYLRVLLVKPEVMMYRLPSGATRTPRAADWNLSQPDWTGRLRVVSQGDKLSILLEDRNTAALFAKCPVACHPGDAVQSVSDSSRYFVLKLKDEANSRVAMVGIGFNDRGDSFDLNVALHDHFRKESAPVVEDGPALDLGFKEGQTIKINLQGSSSSERPRPKKATGTGAIGILPPPPKGKSSAQVPSFRSNVNAKSSEDSAEFQSFVQSTPSVTDSSASSQQNSWVAF